MRKQIKYLSKSTLAVMLTLCMIISCFTVGIVATNAANVEEQQAVGAVLDDDNAEASDTIADKASDSDTAENIGASDDGAVGAVVDSDSAVSANLGSTTDYGVAGTFNSWSTSTRFNSSGTYTVSLTAGTTYEFKITYNGGTKYYGANTTFSATQSEYYFNTGQGNAKVKASVTGDYVFTFKRVDQGDGAVNVGIKFPTAATYYAISKGSTANGDFRLSTASATAGTAIYVYTTPNRGYQVNTVTATGVSTVNNLGNNKYSFKMPSQAVTVTVTFKTATSRTLTARVTSGTGTVTLTLSAGNTVYSAVTTSGTTQASITAYDGETLTITAAAGTGYKLDTLTRDGSTVSSGSTWTVSGATAVQATFTKKTAANQFTATLGSTVTNNSNLYTKIKATYFDYRTDSEVSGSWIRSIKNVADRGAHTATCEPYTKLNTALRNYASGNNIAYPVYFGNFLDRSNGYPGVSSSTNYNFKNKVNNSQGLSGDHKSITGLTGKKLSSNGLPTYYKSGANNENGAEMKLFDKDWLTDSTKNGQGVLASTIDAQFPVKKDGNDYVFNSQSGAQNLYFKNLPESPYYNLSTIYCDVSNVNDDYQNIDWYAYMYEGPNGASKWQQMSWNSSANCWSFPYDGDYCKVIFVRKLKNSGGNWNNAYNQTDDLTLPQGNNQNIKYKISNWSGGSNGHMGGSWQYYNASQNSSGNTSNITLDYYENSNKVYSPNYNNAGFYPFDWSHRGHQAYDLGFGVSMEMKFTLGPNGKLADGTAQKFYYSGDDDLWVFIDDNLILDLGGDHKKSTGTIDFSTGTITGTSTLDAGSGAQRNKKFLDWNNNSGYVFDTTKTVHTLKIFYMERGMFDSNLYFTFNMYPYDDTYEVENVVDAADVNPGLQYIFNTDETFTFTNTSADGKGKGLAYTKYKTSTGTKIDTGTTNATTGNFTLKDDQYDEFTKKFTVGQNLKTVETISSAFDYTTTYKVVDVQNNNKVIKAGNGTDTGNFNYLTTLEGADPELDITHIRTTFTNKVNTTSFMLTKEIVDYDDTATAFPFKLSMDINDGADLVDIDTSGVVYYSSLDGYTEPHTLTSAGTGTIHQDEYLLFEGIPVGVNINVEEPTVSNTNYTPNTTGNANCYMEYDIDHSNASNPDFLYPRADFSTTNRYKKIFVNLQSFDIITMIDELKTYRAEYQLPTRLYGEKLYKLPEGKLTPAMVDAGYASVDDSAHTVSLTKAFVSAHIPYETIFMKNVNWNANNATYAIDSHGCNAYAYLAATSDNKKLTVKIDTNGNDIYDTTISDLDCGDPVLKSTDPVEYVSGTKVGDTPSYWQITDTKGNFVTNCYSQDFYYVAYDNYLVKAIYGQGKGKDLYDKFVSSDINNLGITRSHWNDTTSGEDDNPYYVDYGIEKTYSYYHKDTEYDRLYLDLSIAYNANGKLISTCSSREVTVGYEILIMRENGAFGKVYKDIVINNTDLDNKNRIHVYYGFSNSEANRGLKLAIRSYVSVNGGDKVYSEHVMPFELKTEGSK